MHVKGKLSVYCSPLRTLDPRCCVNSDMLLLQETSLHSLSLRTFAVGEHSLGTIAGMPNPALLRVILILVEGSGNGPKLVRGTTGDDRSGQLGS